MDCAFGIFRSLCRGSLAPRCCFRIVGLFRLGELRRARVLFAGKRIGVRCLRRCARPPPAEPIAHPVRRVSGDEWHDGLGIEPQQAEHVLAGEFARRAGALVAEVTQVRHDPIGIGAGPGAFAPYQGAVPARADPGPFGGLGKPRRRLERGLIGGKLFNCLQINCHAAIRMKFSDKVYWATMKAQRRFENLISAREGCAAKDA
jgi:hypothetical protein